jgi:hypothetical protein
VGNSKQPTAYLREKKAYHFVRFSIAASCPHDSVDRGVAGDVEISEPTGNVYCTKRYSIFGFYYLIEF